MHLSQKTTLEGFYPIREYRIKPPLLPMRAVSITLWAVEISTAHFPRS